MVLNALYAYVARSRRRLWQQSDRRSRLRRPVISVGNLRVGGSGKTPTVAHVAELLCEMGERPAILSRGYARRHAPDGVVVVSDGKERRADLGSSGDEPLMLARQLPRVSVLVARERYLAGVVAERGLGATVHVLDDGFQHMQLCRDVDLLIVSEDDVAGARTLPGGRLREPLDAAAAADALLVPGVSPEAARELAATLHVPAAFAVTRTVEPAQRLDVLAGSVPASADVPVFAVAGIAHPDRFFAELASAGWQVSGREAFRDHHPYRARDVRRLADAERAAGAGAVVTTEKDLMRLLPFRPLPFQLYWVPIALRIEPAAEFREWLGARLRVARARQAARQGWSG
jgi:tetraacyldisaccharide 4'-kinase